MRSVASGGPVVVKHGAVNASSSLETTLYNYFTSSLPQMKYWKDHHE
jgi:hypothetical protein